MPAPFVIAAKKEAIKLATKTLKELGTFILSDLLGCRIKPKGTPFLEVRSKSPKYWFSYTEKPWGTPGFEKTFSKGGRAIFDLDTGALFSERDIDAVFPASERKKVEANFRKTCENVTGDFSFYVDNRAPNRDRGVVRLADGNLYAGEEYSLDGGHVSNPTSYDMISAKNDPNKTKEQRDKADKNKETGTGLIVIGAIGAATLAGS